MQTHTHTLMHTCTNRHTLSHTHTLASHPGYISVTAKACQRDSMRRILQGTRCSHSANKPTDAAAGQSVRIVLHAYVSQKVQLDQAHIRHE